MSAAVIGVLVILWAVVLVPMWLRRHDKANELAAVDRFAGAMRVLSRRSGDRDRRVPGGGRYVVMPARTSESRAMDVFVPEKRSKLAPPAPSAPDLDRAVPAVLASRARRVAARRRLATLLLTVFVVTLLAAALLGGALIAVQACVDVLVVAGVLHLRAGVLAERSSARRAAGRASAVRVRAQADTRWAADGPAYQAKDDRLETEPATVALPLGRQPVQPARVRPPAKARRRPLGDVVAGASSARPAGASPKPTATPSTATPYTAAPVPQVARGRTVDLTQPGKWTESYVARRDAPVAPKLPAPEAALVDQPGYDDPITRQLLEEQRAEAAELAASKAQGTALDQEDDELDRILRRAVGE